jgi:uncharacterized protein DUF6510
VTIHRRADDEMSAMDVLDGNAIAGLLFDVFGDEMTTATGVCSYCGARAQVAELVVYVRAPGTVVRCRQCANLLMVLVTIHGLTCVDLRGLAMLEPESSSEGG